MLNTTTRIILLMAATFVLALAACVERVADDSDAGDRPVPTPVPTKPEDTAPDPDPTAEPTPEPTPASDPTEAGEWYELVVREKTYPEAEIGENVLALAENPEEFGELWTWFEFSEDDPIPELNWDDRVMLFAGTGESSGCPLILESVAFDDDARFIGVEAKRDVPEDTMCTMDWTPRVFVISLDAGVLGEDDLRAAIYDTEIIDRFDPDDGQVIREGER